MAEYHSVSKGSFMYTVLILLPLFTLLVHSQNCPASDLGVVDTDLNPNCDNLTFTGSVEIPGGRACYNGTAVGSIAQYACNCPSQYWLDRDSIRVCQSNNTWTGSVPQCLPQCDNIPGPPNRFNEFVGPVDCSPNTQNVTATYSCGLYRDHRMIQFNTTDGDCRWPDPPCSVGYTSLLTTGTGFYGSIVLHYFILVIGILVCYKPEKIFIPILLVVTLILPPVGFLSAWWLVREKLPAVSPESKDKSFLRKWWKVIVVTVGFLLWLVSFTTYIALAAIFAPQDALPSQGDWNLLIAGYAFMSLTFGYMFIFVQLMCQCGRPRQCSREGKGHCKPGHSEQGEGLSKEQEAAENF